MLIIGTSGPLLSPIGTGGFSGFPDSDLLQLCSGDRSEAIELIFKQGPDDLSNIFYGRVPIGEFRYVNVQVFVVEFLQDVISDEVVQFFNRKDVTCWVDWSSNGYFDTVVVTMAGGVVAFAEKLTILLISQMRLMQAVGCGEFILLGYGYVIHAITPNFKTEVRCQSQT